MLNYNIEEFQNNFSIVMDKVSQGESIVIDKDGKPMAKLEPVADLPQKPVRLGFMAGQANIPDDFDTMGAEEIPSGKRTGFLEGKAKIPDDFDTMGAKEIEKMFYGE